MAKIILNTNVNSVKLRTLFLIVLYSSIPKMMFHCLDFWKNEFAVKQDQKPVSGKTELFGEKGECELLGEQDHGTRIFGWSPRLSLHELFRF